MDKLENEQGSKFFNWCRKHDREIKFCAYVIGASLCGYFIGQCTAIAMMNRKYRCIPVNNFDNFIHSAYDIGIDATVDYIAQNVPEACTMIEAWSAANPGTLIKIPDARVNLSTGMITLKS